MSLIDDVTAKAHLRIVDGEDDGNLALYTNAAELSAQQYLNRSVYADAAAMASAQSSAATAYSDARTAYAAAVQAAQALPFDQQSVAMQVANDAFSQATAAYLSVMRGMVINDEIKAAMLLILSHLYTNREQVIVDYRAAAIEVPKGAETLLFHYRMGLGV